jgi:hypothetical protein
MIWHGSSRLDVVSPIFPFFVIFGAFSWRFSSVDLRPFSWGFGWGCVHEPFVVFSL